MKYKKKLAALESAKKWWDAQPQSYKNSNKKPGGINQRTAGVKK
jgi:hypothetical protein